ncbi:MAG: divalent-cation tolerance protein CutA [Pseudomonadota bacterium]
MNVSHCILISTFPDRASAEKVARGLLGARLAACVQVGAALNSFYAWNNELRHDEEIELRAKTRHDLAPAIEAMLREQHPYELPQIVYVHMNGSCDYLQWVDSCLVS